MIWYPYTQMKTMAPPHEIVDAEGVYLMTKDGRRLIDSIVSWWSVIHGYKHPALNAAICEQVQHFSHVMLGGLTHAPAQKLAAKLRDFLPDDLNYCFFSDSGSVAVEVALKMALQYYINRNRDHNRHCSLHFDANLNYASTQMAPRTMVLSLTNAYHGDTFKTMEVGDDADYHFVLNAYGKSPHVVHIPPIMDALEAAFKRYHAQLNCMIIEPLLQGGRRDADVWIAILAASARIMRSI